MRSGFAVVLNEIGLFAPRNQRRKQANIK